MNGVQRVRLRLSGAVQGVGFRPFVCRLANSMGVSGWIMNDPAGVTVEAEADENSIGRFVHAIVEDAPSLAIIHELAAELIDPVGDVDFRIVDSECSGDRSAVVLPDIAPCAECMEEVRDPAARRHGYAFTNCTNCGPRFSIVTDVPYDRAATTMSAFLMCDACAAEYADVRDRRFHAQPIACPRCGPRLVLAGADGAELPSADPIADVARALADGRIVAVKGIGGYQLMTDAANDHAIAALRLRKQRPSRPFAIMAATLAQVSKFAEVDAAAAAALSDPAAPIVLLPRRRTPGLATCARPAAGVAPDDPRVGVMLPASPLQHLLLKAFGGPVVATSGNLTDEPICTTEEEAFARLRGIADLFLVHDRPVARHVDDSVVDIVDGAPRILRRARGYAPLPVMIDHAIPAILGVGAELKNALAISRGRQVFVSQHVGDLATLEARLAFERTAADLLRLYDVEPQAIAHDLHPDYASTQWAIACGRTSGVATLAVQHHHAHLAACMSENHVIEQSLGVVWDGTGLGSDGTIWGGEFLLGDASAFERVAHLLPFRLPGGDAAVRDPIRVAAALLHAMRDGYPSARRVADRVLGAMPPARRAVLQAMIGAGTASPLTSSAGRLFDGISALLGICTAATYEGEPAIRLEHAADVREYGAYPLDVTTGGDGCPVLDWRALLEELCTDAERGVAVGTIAARVHNGLAHAISLQAALVGCERVALTGGCFQNVLLTERTAALLRRNGFTVLQHRHVSPGDGGIALGQVAVAAARLADTAALGTYAAPVATAVPAPGG